MSASFGETRGFTLSATFTPVASLSRLPVERLRDQLLAFSGLGFDIKPGRAEREQHNFSTEYIRTSLSRLEQDHLIDLILLPPRVVIDPDASQTGFRYGQIPLQPLSNLTRDHQITTAKGVVIGRFGAIQRLPGNELMAAVWLQLVVNLIGTIRPPGTLEGRDDFAVSKDIAMMGVTLRTNSLAARHE